MIERSFQNYSLRLEVDVSVIFNCKMFSRNVLKQERIHESPPTARELRSSPSREIIHNQLLFFIKLKYDKFTNLLSLKNELIFRKIWLYIEGWLAGLVCQNWLRKRCTQNKPRFDEQNFIKYICKYTFNHSTPQTLDHD